METPPTIETRLPLAPQMEKGLRWSALRQLITGLAGTLGALAYTRMLQPEELGAFGLAMLVYNGLFLLIEVPIRDAVVYYPDEEGEHSSAAFWLLCGFSSAAVALVMLTAGELAGFYNSPTAAGLTRALAAAFLVRALAVVPGALLLKTFRFAVHEGIHTITSLMLFAGWVILAARGYGSWSLVLPIVVASIFWAAAAWLPPCWRSYPSPSRPDHWALMISAYSL